VINGHRQGCRVVRIIFDYVWVRNTASGIVGKRHISDDSEPAKIYNDPLAEVERVRWSDLMCKLASEAVRTVSQDINGIKTVDIKRYARVEKIPGESKVLRYNAPQYAPTYRKTTYHPPRLSTRVQKG